MGPLLFLPNEGLLSASNTFSNYDPDLALELLARAGWKKDQASSSLSRLDNKAERILKVELSVPNNDLLLQIGKSIQESWQLAGIEVAIKEINNNEIPELIKTRNYQALIFGHILNGVEDVYSFWHSSQRFYPGLNLSVYANKSLDELLEDVKQELDSNKRQATLTKIAEILSDDSPALFLVKPQYLYITSPQVGGPENQSIN